MKISTARGRAGVPTSEKFTVQLSALPVVLCKASQAPDTVAIRQAKKQGPIGPASTTT